MEAKVVYVDFHSKTLTKMEEIKQVVREPRKKIMDYKPVDYINEAKLMTTRCKEVLGDFLGWSDELEA